MRNSSPFRGHDPWKPGWFLSGASSGSVWIGRPRGSPSMKARRRQETPRSTSPEWAARAPTRATVPRRGRDHPAPPRGVASGRRPRSRRADRRLGPGFPGPGGPGGGRDDRPGPEAPSLRRRRVPGRSLGLPLGGVPVFMRRASSATWKEGGEAGATSARRRAPASALRQSPASDPRTMSRVPPSKRPRRLRSASASAATSRASGRDPRFHSAMADATRGRA